MGNPEATESKEEKFLQLTVDLIKHLSVCLRSMQSYPPGHPFIQKTLTETLNILKKTMAGKTEMAMAIFENNFFVEGLRVDKKIAPAVPSLVNLLNRFDVRSITFREGVAKEELHDLFNLLSMDRVSLQKKGGILKIASEMNLPHIGLNEIEFGIISKQGEVTKGTVTISWDSFQKMLNAPEKMISTLKQNPESIADLMFEAPLAEGGGGAGGTGGEGREGAG
ncbi:hypothetical protein IIA15_11230, partial [candidate division TA06 bacterium]|nr:hypothetical protein [candidate division TA06 bacterium]